MPETQYFSHELTLSAQSTPPGIKFPAKLAYWTFGSPTSPAVLLPTCYGGKLADTSPFLYQKSQDHDAAEPILSPAKYFIIVTGLLSGGESSSPSNTAAPFDGPRFPRTTYEDNIRLQYALCQSLGVERLFAYIGFSMGGQQAYHMSVLFPDYVENMVCLAGSARTSWHNWSFLEGPKAALMSSVDFKEGEYGQPENCKLGKRAFERVYATWALSPQWFQAQTWKDVGYTSLQNFLDDNWSGHDEDDANDMLCLLNTWQMGDITLYHPDDQGDISKSLARIQANCLIFPARTDQYFPPGDNEDEVKYLKRGTLRCIDSVWGHVAAGGGGTKEDTAFIISEIKAFLGI
ncbi:Hypothetical protein R9X50_00668500 [Acrodontium crateriforme]|uniref:AB hydrolase-1 domain-containing protein n=1 Tax=Acrodontium crateriforme TaxID=150365 RepID=A0AAQ3MA84_9PEZI|nr:Hypothetical protein R9X50_00668500 [Acrodontium crateriforme]